MRKHRRDLNPEYSRAEKSRLCFLSMSSSFVGFKFINCRYYLVFISSYCTGYEWRVVYEKSLYLIVFWSVLILCIAEFRSLLKEEYFNLIDLLLFNYSIFNSIFTGLSKFLIFSLQVLLGPIFWFKQNIFLQKISKNIRESYCPWG